MRAPALRLPSETVRSLIAVRECLPFQDEIARPGRTLLETTTTPVVVVRIRRRSLPVLRIARRLDSTRIEEVRAAGGGAAPALTRIPRSPPSLAAPRPGDPGASR